MTDRTIADNFEAVRASIREAARKSGRGEGAVRLCAVSKFHPVQDVMAALSCGQALFGENRVQEAVAKFGALPALRQERPGLPEPELHIIGNLQLNKVRKALSVARCIQSVDREDVLAEIEKQAEKLGARVSVFFEIHTGEETKAGYASPDDLYRTLELCAENRFPHVVPVGLMTMAPFTDDERAVHAAFASVRLLRDEVNARFPGLPVRELSMGMSGDYRIAIEEGSTLVRIGTALFGERGSPAAV